ncbi:hypothetical protein ACFQ1S_16195 [Kibdelosporangium lantanae]|uniref:Peptidase inhibitor family I36 n=1 Tax=Kibdelosporangium lantanae TaxID=1497396 RepID=A0ABW3M9W4_9PSEU
MSRVRKTIAVVVAGMAGLVVAGTSQAQATESGWNCEYGRVCLYIDTAAEQRWVVDGCGWHNRPSGLPFKAVKTAGNGVKFSQNGRIVEYVPPWTNRILGAGQNFTNFEVLC